MVNKQNTRSVNIIISNTANNDRAICKQRYIEGNETAPFFFSCTSLTCCLRMYLFLTSFPQISQGTLFSWSSKQIKLSTGPV